jgi:hypothetical protein
MKIEELIFIAESMALRGDNQETKDIGKITAREAGE